MLFLILTTSLLAQREVLKISTNLGTKPNDGRFHEIRNLPSLIGRLDLNP